MCVYIQLKYRSKFFYIKFKQKRYCIYTWYKFEIDIIKSIIYNYNIEKQTLFENLKNFCFFKYN
jgi:hypothetical protein